MTELVKTCFGLKTGLPPDKKIVVPFCSNTHYSVSFPLMDALLEVLFFVGGGIASSCLVAFFFLVWLDFLKSCSFQVVFDIIGIVSPNIFFIKPSIDSYKSHRKNRDLRNIVVVRSEECFFWFKTASQAIVTYGISVGWWEWPQSTHFQSKQCYKQRQWTSDM